MGCGLYFMTEKTVFWYQPRGDRPNKCGMGTTTCVLNRAERGEKYKVSPAKRKPLRPEYENNSGSVKPSGRS